MRILNTIPASGLVALFVRRDEDGPLEVTSRHVHGLVLVEMPDGTTAFDPIVLDSVGCVVPVWVADEFGEFLRVIESESDPNDYRDEAEEFLRFVEAETDSAGRHDSACDAGQES